VADLKFAVLFTAVDQLSGKVGSIGDGFFNLGNRVQSVGERFGAVGARMVRFAEKAGLTRDPKPEN